MRFGSVCAGIEVASLAFNPLGWECAFAAEIDPFCRALLKQRHPATPLHGDFTTIEDGNYDPIGLLVGGTPCQSFSLAGNRGGLADDRGNLSLEYIRLADRLRPRWLVWENVPGVFSSKDPDDDAAVPGEDFACFLSGLVRWDVGIPAGGWQNSGIITPAPVDGAYGVAWGVLNAEHFGVPQRRRRVIVVGYLGDWRRAAAVLLERHSLSGDPAPGGGARSMPAPTITGGARARGGYSTDDIPLTPVPLGLGEDGETARALNACHIAAGRFDASVETFVDQPIAFTSKDHGQDAGEVSPTLRSMGHDKSHANGGGQVAVAYAFKPSHFTRDKDGAPSTIMPPLTADADKGDQDPVIFQTRIARNGRGQPESIAPALNGADAGATSDMRPVLATSTAVRRLTPLECERLQGVPDGYTDVIYRGGPAADSPRYKALGNAMCVPVIAWVGRRIQEVENCG